MEVQGTNFDDIGLHVFAIANCDSVLLVAWCFGWMERDLQMTAHDCYVLDEIGSK